MKLTIDSKELKAHLSTVIRAIPARPTHSILSNIYLETTEKELTLIATDLSLGIRDHIEASVEQTGSITVPAKLFYDIVSRLEGEVSIELEEVTLQIKSKSGKYKIQGIDPEDYPALPVIKGELIAIPASALLAGLKGTLFATSADDSKQVLGGVHLKSNSGHLEFAATDGHRLAVIGVETEAADLEMTIPAKALQEVERMVSKLDDNSEVRLQFNESQIVVEIGYQRLTSRRLEGVYPAYQQLIPSQFTSQVNINRKNFISALERVAVLAVQKNNIIKCFIDSTTQQIKISIEASEVGGASETIESQITAAEDLELALNVKYLLEGLKTFNSTEVLLQINQPTSPVILSPIGGIKTTYLIMPVQIRENKGR